MTPRGVSTPAASHCIARGASSGVCGGTASNEVLAARRDTDDEAGKATPTSSTDIAVPGTLLIEDGARRAQRVGHFPHGMRIREMADFDQELFDRVYN